MKYFFRLNRQFLTRTAIARSLTLSAASTSQQWQPDLVFSKNYNSDFKPQN
jgi:hypothetical protein